MSHQICLYAPKLGHYQCLETNSTDAHQAVEELLGNGQRQDKDSSIVDTPVGEVLTIHNPEGLRDPSQVIKMADQLEKGREVFHENGLPNVKLIITPDKRLLLFDGHHSILAHLRFGHKTLKEVPHLVFSSSDFGPTTAREIARFFPPSDRDKIEQNWFGWTVNWQSDKEKTTARRLATIGQLADALGN